MPCSWAKKLNELKKIKYLLSGSLQKKLENHISIQFSSVTQSCLILATPWTAACQASLSITNSRSLPKLISIESLMPSNHLILYHPILLLPSIFPSIRVFSKESDGQVLEFHIRWSSIGISASTSVLPMNTQDWSPLGWTGWISLQSKVLSRVFSHHSSKAQLSL